MSFGRNGSNFPKGGAQKHSLRATSLYNVWIMIEPRWFAIEALTIDPTSYYNVHCELCTIQNILHSRFKHWRIKSDPNGTTQQIGKYTITWNSPVQWKEWTSMSRALGSLRQHHSLTCYNTIIKKSLQKHKNKTQNLITFMISNIHHGLTRWP
jgi:hypothetical protein